MLFSSFGFLVFGQTFYEKAAQETCDCLQVLPTVESESYINCLSESFTKLYIIETDTELREKANTVDGIQAMLKDIDLQTQKICGSAQNLNNLEAKKDQFYKYSDNESAKNWYIIAKDAMKEEKYDIAIEGFLLSLKEDDKNVLALDDLAVSYRRIEDFENAIKYYNQSLNVFPEGDFALMNIGVIYSMMEDYEKSNLYYKNLIKYYPDNPEGYFGYGKNSVMQDDFENALKNIVIAHHLYESENSPYKKDTELIILSIKEIMADRGMQKEFEKMAAENNIHFTD